MTTAALQKVLEDEGIKIHCDVNVKAARRDGSSRILVLEDGTELCGEELLVAVGQQANTSDLGLDAAGVRT